MGSLEHGSHVFTFFDRHSATELRTGAIAFPAHKKRIGIGRGAERHFLAGRKALNARRPAANTFGIAAYRACTCAIFYHG